MDDLRKERIKFNVEIIKLLTVLVIATGGGALALLTDRGTVGLTLRWTLIYSGMLVAAVSAVLAIAVYRNTLKKLRNNDHQ